VLKLRCEEPLSDFAFNFNLRRYTLTCDRRCKKVRSCGIHKCARQGLTLVHVRAQLEQLQDTFRVKLGYTVDRRAQLELKSERV